MLSQIRERYQKLTRFEKIVLGLIAVVVFFFLKQYVQWQRFTFESHTRWGEIEKHLDTQNEILMNYAQRVSIFMYQERDKPGKLIDALEILKTQRKRLERMGQQQQIQENYNYLKAMISADENLSKDLELAQMGLEIEKIQNRLSVEVNRFNELEERKEFLQKQFPLSLAGLFFSKAEKFNFQTE